MAPPRSTKFCMNGSGKQDLQSAWLLFLLCATNSRQFAKAHDNAIWSCFTTLLGLPFGTERQDLASVLFASSGYGLHSASRSRTREHSILANSTSDNLTSANWRKDRPPPDRPKFRSFFPSPPQFSLFCLSCSSFPLNFWWCF